MDQLVYRTSGFLNGSHAAMPMQGGPFYQGSDTWVPLKWNAVSSAARQYLQGLKLQSPGYINSLEG
jgi:hypothetical protein